MVSHFNQEILRVGNLWFMKNIWLQIRGLNIQNSKHKDDTCKVVRLCQRPNIIDIYECMIIISQIKLTYIYLNFECIMNGEGSNPSIQKHFFQYLHSHGVCASQDLTHNMKNLNLKWIYHDFSTNILKVRILVILYIL